jgi:pentatricopeptide repeat protein
MAAAPALDDAPQKSEAALSEIAETEARESFEPPRPSRRRGRLMRKVYYREGNVLSSGAARPHDLKAMEEAAQALRENPDSRDRHRQLVRALCRLGNVERARQVVDKWIERDRLDPEALTYLSDVVGRQGKRDQAIRLLSGIVDLRPDDRVLQQRLARAFERAGMAERACAHRVSLAEIDQDDARAVGAAVRCERELGNQAAAQRLLDALPDDEMRERVEEAAAGPAKKESVKGALMLDARWSEDADVDLSLITPQGTRLSWLGGRVSVVGAQAREKGREELGLRFAGVGSYVIEVSRTDPDSTAPVSGKIAVEVLGVKRDLPFKLTSQRTAVGRVVVRRKSRLEPR